MKRTTKIAIGAAVTLGLAAAVVSAQPSGYGPGAGMGWGMGHGALGMGSMARGMGPGAMGFGGHGAAAENRLAALKSQLKITAEQETAWQAFAAQAKSQADAMGELMNTMHSQAPTSAPERVALHNEIMTKRLAQTEAVSTAFKDLYAVLTPEQQAIADRGFGPMGPRFGVGPGGRSR